MKKQAFIYLFLLIVSTIIWSSVVIKLVYIRKHAGIINVFYDDNSTIPVLSLSFKSDKEMADMLKNKLATFKIKIIRVSEIVEDGTKKN